MKPTINNLDYKLDVLIALVQEIRVDTRVNTEFRLKAKGIIGAVAFICTTTGGGLLWIFNKLLKN